MFAIPSEFSTPSIGSSGSATAHAGSLTITVPDLGYPAALSGVGPRVRGVVESFRFLGSDAPDERVLVTTAFTVSLGQLTAIVGPSGSGKSTLLRHLSERIGGVSLPAAPPDGRPIIDVVGVDLEQAIGLLTAVGLGEGNLFLRTAATLSEGQRYRLRLALAFGSATHAPLCLDEFGSTLDRSTGRALARALARESRRAERRLVVCCNDPELAEALSADTIVSLGFDHKVSVEYKQPQAAIPLPVRIERGDIKAYDAFRRYHYLDLSPSLRDPEVFLARLDGAIVGVHVCHRSIGSDVVAAHPFFGLVRQHVLSVYRTVVHPEYRGAGVARQLYEGAANHSRASVVEVRSAFLRFVPYPAAWGYCEYEERWFAHHPAHDRVRDYLATLGVDSLALYRAATRSRVLAVANLPILGELLYSDREEKMHSLVGYFRHLLNASGVAVGDSDATIVRSWLGLRPPPEQTDDFDSMLASFPRPESRAFYKVISASRS